MRSKRAREIRRYAEMKTIGQPTSETRRVIKLMKAEYAKHLRPAKHPASNPGGFFCSRKASAERQRIIAGRFDPAA